MINLKTDFTNWLVRQGYAERTKSDKPSTVYDYIKTLERVCKNEGYITWEELAAKGLLIVSNYQGKYQTVLAKYNEFLLVFDIPRDVRRQRNENFMLAMTEDTSRNAVAKERDYYSTEELAEALGVNPRTVKRWRKARIEQNKLEQVHENTNGESPIGPKVTQVGKKYQYKKADVQKYLRID